MQELESKSKKGKVVSYLLWHTWPPPDIFLQSEELATESALSEV